MGTANLFQTQSYSKMAQSQQDTKFEIKGTVSIGETMFHPRAKLREMKQFVSARERQKGAPPTRVPLLS